MFQSVKLSCGQILGLILFGATVAAQQQVTTVVEAKSASFAVAEKALHWMPESFRRVMARNMDSLKSGTNDVNTQKFLMETHRSILEEEVLERTLSTVDRLRSQPKFSKVARDFGALAHMMFLLNLPEREPSSSDKLLVLSDVIGRNSQAFRIVVYDASEVEGSRNEVRTLLETVRQRRSRLSERFSNVEVAQLPPSPTVPLDPRSPLYGIAAVVYSHAINDTARAWLWIWKSANGDMARRPSFQTQP